MKVLYISYDGALDPLGRAQVVPYVEGLAGRGHHFDLLTFEKPERWRAGAAVAGMEARLLRAGVRWHPLPYTKRPPVVGTARDLARGVRRARAVVLEEGVDLIHARSYPSALVAHRLWRTLGVPYLFDMRGFYPEERTEGGLWRHGGALYEVAKRLERDFLRDAAGVVTLTRASLPVLRREMVAAGSRAPVRVIPTCVNLERFPLLPPPSPPFTLAYFGSVGTWYLLDEMLRLAAALLEEDAEARLLFLVNLLEQEGGRVRDAARRAGVDEARLTVTSASHEGVPDALRDAWATYFLIRPGGSKVASAATKFGESLALGRPVIANRGVGDTADVIAAEGVGVVVDALDAEGYRQAAGAILEVARARGVAERCRAAAERLYGLEGALDAYEELYGRAVPRGPR